MVRNFQESSCRRNLICIDSYRDGILEGRLYDPCFGSIRFESLSRFLLQMEQLLDDRKTPQVYTTVRTFLPPQPQDREEAKSPCRGHLATFELQVLFRQHTSWQGTLCWQEQRQVCSFRSVLELVTLLDSALRTPHTWTSTPQRISHL